MKYLTEILYGCIVGHFLANAWKKLTPTVYKGRYAIIAEHCNWVDVNVFVGTVDTMQKMQEALDAIDNSAFFIPLGRDLMDPDGLEDFKSIKMTKFENITYDEREDLREARAICQGVVFS